MYKGTHLNNQRRADALTIKNMQTAESDITDEQRIVLLKEKLRFLDEQIIALPKNHPERRTLGKSKALLAFELNSLRGVSKRPGLGQTFQDVAFRILPKTQYEEILQEARHVYDLRNGVSTQRSASKYAKELGVMISKREDA